MKTYITTTFLLITTVLLLGSCKKKEQVNPKADFEIAGVTAAADGTYHLPTFIQITLKNSSSDASGYTWDFGNGSGSSVSAPDYGYAVKGDYNLTLKAVNDNGSGTSTLTKKITIVDRKPYTATVKNPNLSNGTSLQLFLRIYEPSAGNLVPPLNGNTYNSKVYYQSKVSSVVYDSQNGAEIGLDNPPVLQPSKEIREKYAPGTFVNYGYCLYGLQNGNEILLSSSWDPTANTIFNDNLKLGVSVLTFFYGGYAVTINASNNK
ncbi:PKD domain-containing protein [Pedobacter sp. 22226]|uniref:PKD domain-containing protein n=1 Tax=Pedobacter sp. 22226 TaxID=3453894 RepID=UPI003F83D8BC